jgi:hypothetical protein
MTAEATFGGGTNADQWLLVDLECVLLDQGKAAGEQGFEFGECGEAAAIPLHRGDVRSGIQQGAGEAAWSRTHFVDSLRLKVAGDRGNSSE